MNSISLKMCMVLGAGCRVKTKDKNIKTMHYAFFYHAPRTMHQAHHYVEKE